MQKFLSKNILLEDGHSIVIDGEYFNTYQANYAFVIDHEYLTIAFRKEKKVSLNDKVETIETPDINHDFLNHQHLIKKCRETFGVTPRPHTSEDGCFGRGWLVNDIVYIA